MNMAEITERIIIIIIDIVIIIIIIIIRGRDPYLALISEELVPSTGPGFSKPINTNPELGLALD